MSSTEIQRRLSYAERIAEVREKNSKILNLSLEWIHNSESPLLWELTAPKEIAMIEGVLLSCAKALGIRAGIDDEQIVVIRNFVLQHQRYITLAELKYAFEVYAIGELPIKKQSFSHYGVFNIEFVGVILNAYNSYSFERIQSDRLKYNAIDVSKQLPAPPPQTKEQEAKMFHEIALKHIEQYNQLPPFCMWELCFYHLETTGLVKMSNIEKKRYAKKMKDKLEQVKFAKTQGRLTMFQLMDIKKENDAIKLPAFCREERAKEYYLTLLKK